MKSKAFSKSSAISSVMMPNLKGKAERVPTFGATKSEPTSPGDARSEASRNFLRERYKSISFSASAGRER